MINRSSFNSRLDLDGDVKIMYLELDFIQYAAYQFSYEFRESKALKKLLDLDLGLYWGVKYCI